MARSSPALLLAHVVWSTQRRRPLLAPAFDGDLLAIFGAKAREVGCAILVAGCAVDHVHVIARVAASRSLGEMVHRIKGGASYDVNRARLLPDRLVWQESYWAESISPADVSDLAPYLRAQRRHHDDSHPAERWHREA